MESGGGMKLQNNGIDSELPRAEGFSVGPFSTSNQSSGSSTSNILGIWRLGESIHRSDTAELSIAQPADSVDNPRWDYVVKHAIDASANLEAQRQIEQAVAVASEVNHPNLVPVLDGAVTGVTPYVVMPNLAGETMNQHLKTNGSVALPVVLWFVRQVAQATESLHRGGWIHGDIKPSNIIVGSRGHVTLIDLGFATRIHAPMGRLFRGTPEYASPELTEGGVAALPAMDVFAIGRILWKNLVETNQRQSKRVVSVAELIEAMVHPDPQRRPSIGSVVQSLLRLEIETLGQHIEPETAVRRAA